MGGPRSKQVQSYSQEQENVSVRRNIERNRLMRNEEIAWKCRIQESQGRAENLNRSEGNLVGIECKIFVLKVTYPL